MVKTQLIKFVQEFFRNKRMAPGMNKTFLVLIPKTKYASHFNHFSSISLCNFCYKVVSRILANRLRKYLKRIVSPNQGAFVEGRWIAENTIIAQELVHKVKKHQGKQGLLLMKIDLQKAYDSLE